VSGGPDSVALMLLAARWSRRPERTVVATVDHGLRSEAFQEAQRVAEWARQLGFAHRLLRWEGPKPVTRLQERTRAARYALLAACAKEIDANCAIVTAHHADDQAETILFRLCRGSGLKGLAGMARVSGRDGVKLLRPLLGLPKAALEALCHDAGHPYIRDPSNENPDFARVRLRRLGATLAEQGLDREALLRLGRRAAQADEALAFCTTKAKERALVASEANSAQFDANALHECPQEILLRLLEAQIIRLGGKEPRLDRLERAAGAVAASLATRVSKRITLAEVLIEVDEASMTLSPAPARARRRKTGGSSDDS